MRKSLSTSSFKFLCLILLAWAATDFLAARSKRVADFLLKYSEIAFDNPLQLELKLANAKHLPGKKLILILGSSIARESVDERILESELGKNYQVLNLGFFHARTIDLWMLSDRLLKLKPDLIIMPTFPGESLIEYSYSLTMPYYFNWNLFELIGAREVMEHPHEFSFSLFSRASFLFRYRDSIASALYRAAKDKLGIEAWNQSGVFLFSEGKERLPELDPQLSVFGQKFAPGKELILRALERLLRKFSASGVNVMIVEMPPHPKFKRELERLAFTEMLDWRESGFQRQMNDWAQIPNVKAMVLPPNLIKNEEFADYLHLNSTGRRVFSLWLAQTLKAR